MISPASSQDLEILGFVLSIKGPQGREAPIDQQRLTLFTMESNPLVKTYSFDIDITLPTISRFIVFHHAMPPLVFFCLIFKSIPDPIAIRLSFDNNEFARVFSSILQTDETY